MTDWRGGSPGGGSFGGPAGASPDRLFSLGSQSHQTGQLAAAEQQYREALKMAPQHVNSLYFLGVIGLQTGRNELAAEMIGKAVVLHGKEPDWHYNLALAYERLDRWKDAVSHHRRAIALKPDHVNAHNHLGIAAMSEGRAQDAMAQFQRALAIDPRHIPTLMSLGNLLASTGELEKAADIYQSIIKTRPNPVAYENLARTFLVRGQPWQVIPILQQGFRMGATPALRELFVLCAQDMQATSDDPGLRDLTLRAFSETWGHAFALANLAASLIKSNAGIAACIARGASAWPRRLPAEELFGPSELEALSADRLLQILLESTPVSDVVLERFLTVARFALLKRAAASDNAGIDANALRFFTALARQCFINEYVFDALPEEWEIARALRGQLAGAMQSSAQIPPHWVAAVAAYFPLYALPEAQSLLNRSWPDPIRALLTQQVREPQEEFASRSTIARLTPIDDQVSLKVREQYEENPYPRWIKVLPMAPRASLEQHLRIYFPHASFDSLGKGGKIDILVAGCGTGPAVAEMAQQFPAARILAIDLSLASLAYARRKIREAGFTNVEFGQADILGVGSIGRSFDVIESRGVLHHMADPLAGWRALLSALRSHGFMAIGLYSEIARQDVLAARALIAERGYGATAEDIRRFRQELIDLDDHAPMKSIVQGDFSTTSDCRDLLFHVHEHRFTLPQIKEFLNAHGLRLLGFNLPEALLWRYSKRFPEDKGRTDLDSWHAFETENPYTFRGMYQFWVQRET